MPLIPLLNMRINKNKIKKILIVRTDCIGDLVLMTPAISALRKNYPNAHIAILLQQYTFQLMECHPDIDEIIVDKIKAKKIKNIMDFLRYAREIKSRKFDLAIDLFGLDIRYPLLLLLARIPFRIGDKSRILLGVFYNIGFINRYKDYNKHIVDLHLELLKCIGIKNDFPKLTLKVNESVNNDFDKKLISFGITNNDYLVGIHAACNSSKSWNELGYASVIDWLNRNYNAKIILTGSSSEKTQGERIISLCKNKPIDLIGKTSLAELMALVQRMNLFIGSDTGPTHIAAAFRVPTVCIIPTKAIKPARWAPYGNKQIVLYYNPQTRCELKCSGSKCKSDFCATSITPQMVFDAIGQLRSGKSMGKKDLQALSYNALIIYDKNNYESALNAQNILRENNCYSVLHKSESIKSIKQIFNLIEKENILIMHFLGRRNYLRVWLANILSGTFTSNATVLAKGYIEGEDLLLKYNNICRSSLY